MNTNDPMTQERLDAIQERLDAVEVDPPDEYWSYGAGIAWVPFCLHARDDIPALLAEVERLRALTTVTGDMVERVARESYGPQRWDRILSEWPILAPVKLAAHRAMTRAVLNAALNPGEGS